MIDLCPIAPENHSEVRLLSVLPEQERLVASVEKTLADAYVYKEAVFRAAFEGETAVGFVLVFPVDDDDKHIVNIVRLVIDARFQGKGLGRELLNKTLAWISTFSPAVDRAKICALPANHAALTLYKSVGFHEQGIQEGEVTFFKEMPGAP